MAVGMHWLNADNWSLHILLVTLDGCGLQVFNELNTDNWSTVEELRSCIGDINADQKNDIMEAEMESQRGSQDVGEVRASRLSHLILLSGTDSMA